MRVAEIMTGSVLTISAEASLRDALRLMVDNRIGGLPVVASDGSVVGIITEGDVLRRSEIGTEEKRRPFKELMTGIGRLAEEYIHSHARRVGDLMTASPVTIGPEASIEEAVDLMLHHGVRRLPVVTEGRLVGVVSRRDIIVALLVAVDARVAGSPLLGTLNGDAEIRERVLAEIAAQSWADPGVIRVIVEDGTVTLSGSILDERERDALRVIAENVPGVRAVKDSLIQGSPFSLL